MQRSSIKWRIWLCFTNFPHDSFTHDDTLHAADGTMAVGISWLAVLMSSFKSGTVCRWIWYTFDFIYNYSQKSIGMISGDFGGHKIGKWRDVTLSPSCWLKRCLTEDPTCVGAPSCIHTTSNRALQIAISNLFKKLRAEYERTRYTTPHGHFFIV